MTISLCENSEPSNAEKKSTPGSVGVTLTGFINQLQKKDTLADLFEPEACVAVF